MPKGKEAEKPSMKDLEKEAKAAADKFAKKKSEELSGHGRAPHGKDAKGKSKHHDAGKSAQEAWDEIYDQTLNRLKKEYGYK